MTITRAIPLSIHGALEVIAAPAIMAAPFLLGFGEAATVVSIMLGAVLLGLAVQLEAPRRTVPLSAHASLDYTLAAVAAIAGLAIGIAAGEWTATAFLVGIGVAQVALTSSTRFSAPAGASSADRPPKTTHISLLPVPRERPARRGASLVWGNSGIQGFSPSIGADP